MIVLIKFTVFIIFANKGGSEKYLIGKLIGKMIN